MNLTAERLREVVSYDRETGIFTYLTRRGSYRSGLIAGSVTPRGYISVCIDRKCYLAHRLAWLHVNGQWPDGMIDHINGNIDDNRYSNLRIADPSQNCANSRVHFDNRTGFKGISRSKRRWIAQICHKRKRYFLGSFRTPEDAHAAYAAKAKELFGEYARTA